jgi:hypothetical protein
MVQTGGLAMLEYALILLPLIAILTIVLFGVALVYSAGFREVVVGMGGEGRFSLLNVFSVEGVGAILVLGLLMGGGVIFPLYQFPDACFRSMEERAKEHAKVETELDDLRDKYQSISEKLARYESPQHWSITGYLSIPDDSNIGFSDYQEARLFWLQGRWIGFSRNFERVRYAPYDVQINPLPNMSYRVARFEIKLIIPGGVDLPDEIAQIRYEHWGATHLQGRLFDELFEAPWIKLGSADIEFSEPIELHLFDQRTG